MRPCDFFSLTVACNALEDQKRYRAPRSASQIHSARSACARSIDIRHLHHLGLDRSQTGFLFQNRQSLRSRSARPRASVIERFTNGEIPIVLVARSLTNALLKFRRPENRCGSVPGLLRVTQFIEPFSLLLHLIPSSCGLPVRVIAVKSAGVHDQNGFAQRQTQFRVWSRPRPSPNSDPFCS